VDQTFADSASVVGRKRRHGINRVPSISAAGRGRDGGHPRRDPGAVVVLAGHAADSAPQSCGSPIAGCLGGESVATCRVAVGHYILGKKCCHAWLCNANSICPAAAYFAASHLTAGTAFPGPVVGSTSRVRGTGCHCPDALRSRACRVGGRFQPSERAAVACLARRGFDRLSPSSPPKQVPGTGPVSSSGVMLD
jgi:hypothetical protein